MTAPVAARLRRLWLDVHLWLGAGLLVALIPLGLTGSALVWRGAFDHALHPERYAISGGEAKPPADAYAGVAESAFQGRAVLAQVRLPAEPGDPVVAVGRIDAPAGAGGRPRSLNAWIDPATGKVLATAEIARDATMTMHRLHGTLMIPGLGRKVVGWLGWAMFASCVTGLWLWWPRRGVLRGLRWRRGASQLFNLHHMAGFWICLPLAVVSLTGVYISFPQTARALFAQAEPTRAPGRAAPRFAAPLAAPRTPAAAAVAAALALEPGGRIRTLNVPTAGERPAWRVELEGPDGAVEARVEDATGRAKIAPARGGPGGRDPLSGWMRRIHDGSDMGPAWRAIVTLTGLAPPVLGLTGLVMWLRRRARRRVLARA